MSEHPEPPPVPEVHGPDLNPPDLNTPDPNRPGAHAGAQGEAIRRVSLAAAITAGGQSRRFGQDKALYVLGGVSLLERVAASLENAAPRLLIAPEGRYALSGWQNRPDLRPGQGPLAGLETALDELERLTVGGGWLAFCAVDLPYLTPDYWELLCNVLASEQADVQAVVGSDAAGRVQPLAALYHTSALPQVRAQLDTGDRRMGSLLEHLRRSAVAWEQIGDAFPQVYTNLNTLQSAAALT